jgi:predicted phosphodiesterase
MSRLLLGALLLAPAVASARDPFLKGPYLQRATADGVTLMWQADPPAPGRVTVSARGEPDRVVEAPKAGIHELRIDGLSPGKRYRYVVECDGQTQGGELMTAVPPSEPFSFVVFGDTRSNADSHRAVVERVRREVPDFLLLTGDMVDDGAKESDWQTFFDVQRPLLAENVMFPAVGNHDRHQRTRGADAYRRYFSLPADTPDPERYYSFRYGNARFLVLDSNEHSFALTDQTAWLEKELRRAAVEPGILHRFVVMHHPPFSTSLHGGHPELREMWTPIFERYGVEAVFSGHDHTYEHSERNGVHYLVSGGGGAPLYPRDPRAAAEDKAASIYFERTLHYVRVHVAGARVEIAAIREDGSVIETLSWGSLPRNLVATAPPAQVAPPVVTVAGAVAPPGQGAGCATGRGTGGSWLVLAALALTGRIRRSRRM